MAALLAALLLALFLVGGANRGTAQEVSIKVLVNDDPISDYDIDQRMRFLAITEQSQPSPELKQKAIDMLIEERLQMQEGRRQGVSPDDDELNKILGDMAKKNNLDVDGLTTALGQDRRQHQDAQGPHQVAARLARDGADQVPPRRADRRCRHHRGDDGESGTEAGTAPATPAESTLQLRQVKFEIPAGADQGTIAARLAAAENLRARFDNCADLAKGVEGASVKTLTDEKPSSLAQPARLLVTSAKIGQMTPPTVSAASVELYAVCGKRSFRGDDAARTEIQRKLMNDEMKIRAERLLRDLKQDAFIEYR